MNSLAAAFELFRRGLFVESRQAALATIHDAPTTAPLRGEQNFWAYYLAAISAAFEPDLPAFEKYLNALDAYAVENAYAHYLKAYYALLKRDVEKALWHYLEIAETDEGWLARSLVKKFRKAKELKDVEHHAADYIVLPGEIPPEMRTAKEVASGGLEPAAQLEKDLTATPRALAQGHTRASASSGWQFDRAKKQRSSSKATKVSYARVMISVTLAFLLVAGYIVVRNHRRAANPAAAPDLQIADSAAVMPVVDKAKILYTYRTREAIIGDFEKAKENLHLGKVNQSRYLLNRLLFSNADFQTREKARAFLGFIPDPAFKDFNDNLRLKDLFEKTKLYPNSLVVLTGELRDESLEQDGKLYQMIARESDVEYRVHVFKGPSVQEEKARTANGKALQVYGRFKGLVGAQKAIYLEALRIWR